MRWPFRRYLRSSQVQPKAAVIEPDRILTLFLSNGKSLSFWKREGIFSREMALYQQFLRDDVFQRIQIFSYDPADRGMLKDLRETEPIFQRFDILAPAFLLAGVYGLLWGLVGPFAYRRALRRSLALKTNQISGSWAAVLAAVLTRRPLFLRMGYLQSRDYQRAGYRLRSMLARIAENIAYRRAQHVLVSATDVAKELEALPRTANKTVLTPTYVDVSLFWPKEEYHFEEALIAVSRFAPAKNLPNLLRACALADHDLVLVGAGEGETELRALAAELPIRVTFTGRIANEALAAKLREHSVYILPSIWEGLPKSLIEAMACGLIPLGTRTEGIVDLIRDGENGYLIEGTGPEAIAHTIKRAFAERNKQMGRRARATVEDVFSLERYAEREADLYKRIVLHGVRTH